MQTQAQKTASNIKAFSKMLDDTEHMNGLVLKIYEEFIVDYVTVWADEIGWDKAVELARGMQAKGIRITKAEFLVDIVDFGIETVKLWDL